MIRFLGGALFLVLLAAAQPQLDLPYGPSKRLALPDGNLVLYEVPFRPALMMDRNSGLTTRGRANGRNCSTSAVRSPPRGRRTAPRFL
jgi:hypothetical protein